MALNITDFKALIQSLFATAKPGKIRAKDARDAFNAVADSFVNINDSTGTYTAIITPVEGIDSIDSQNLWYSRNGDIVTVDGVVGATTNTNTNVSFRVSLPIEKDFTTANDCVGFVSSFELSLALGFIYSDATEDEAIVSSVGTDKAGEIFNIHFSYRL